MNSWMKLGLRICCAALIVFSGCEQQPEKEAVQTDQHNGSAQTKETRIIFYNWDEYIGEKTLDNFVQATGISVELKTYDDEEFILGALQSGAISADIVVVSQSLAQEMGKAKLLQSIDYQKLPNTSYLKTEYVPALDKDGQRFWVPYLWGITGLVINSKYVTGDINSWSVLFDNRYAGKVGMLNNVFEVVAAASKMLGYGVNPTSVELDDIGRLLMAQKKLVHGYYGPGVIMEMMKDERLWLAQLYNGDGLVLADETDDIQFVTPQEGTAIWVDVFVIPQGAKNIDQALQFINYIHTPQVLGKIASELWFASTNIAAEQYMEPHVLQADEVYPSPQILAKSEFFNDMGMADSVRKRMQIWSDLMAE